MRADFSVSSLCCTFSISQCVRTVCSQVSNCFSCKVRVTVAVCQCRDQSNCKKPVFATTFSQCQQASSRPKMGEWGVWFVLGCRRWVEQTVQGVVGYHSLQQSPDHTTSHWEVRENAGIWRVMSTGTTGSDWKAALCNKPHCKHHHTAGFEGWGRYSNIINTF